MQVTMCSALLGFLLQAPHKISLSKFCDQGTQAMLLPAVANKSALNTAWKPYNIGQLFSRSICASL